MRQQNIKLNIFWVIGFGLGGLITLILLNSLTETLTVTKLNAAEVSKNLVINFNSDIRPILANNCYACHGPDQEKRMAGLRLDNEKAAKSTLRSGHVAVAEKDIGKSSLISRITAKDDAIRMPPAYSGNQLTQKQILLLTEWIRQGANWETHWAYLSPIKPSLPKIKNKNWIKNNIDNFVLARLEKEGIKPSPKADKRTLIRRLSFDLRGLPPTLLEVEKFLSDKSPDAYSNLIDQFMDSPLYGERMAMNWLDLARYADSDGYHTDNPRSMWKYRDWVIDAFNNKKRFDEFTVEQLAGDLLIKPTIDQKIATAFNRNGMTSTEGGADAREYLSKYVIDRVNTTATVWLGSTVACAECHDHKFDPFTQEEFYQFYDFFHQIPEKGLDADPAPPYMRLPSIEQSTKVNQLETEIRDLESQKKAFLEMTHDGLEDAQALWEHKLIDRYKNNQGLEKQQWWTIGPFLSNSGDQAFHTAFPPEKEISLSGVYEDGKLSWSERPGWEDGKNHGLLGKKAATYLYRKILTKSSRKITFFIGGNSPFSDGLKIWLNGKNILNKPVKGCEPAEPIELPVKLTAGLNQLLIKVVNYGGGYGFYFSTEIPQGNKELKQVKVAFKKPLLERSGSEKVALRNYFRENHVKRIKILNKQLTKLRNDKDLIEKKIPTIRIMEDMEFQRPTHVLIRGDYRNLGKKVSAGVPQFLPTLPKVKKVNRLDLAKWLVDSNHPLVGRVTVNRLWQLYFGTGLVKTSNEFGTQGELPSHPKLLDWLAREFVDGGWNIQDIQKKILTSATYQQTSRYRSELLGKDPENRLLAKGPRLRLSAEIIRDNALSISGLLDRNRPTGGPSVFPYQPTGLWENKAFYCRALYEQSQGPDLYRRSLYTFWKRSVPNPVLMTFDAPDREVCTVKRERTVTPLQAFVTLNEITYVEASRVFAERILSKAGPTFNERIQYAYQVALARLPSSTEKKIIKRTYQKILKNYQGDRKMALSLVNIGQSPRTEELDLMQHAAWTGVASMILNLDETMTKE